MLGLIFARMVQHQKNRLHDRLKNIEVEE